MNAHLMVLLATLTVTVPSISAAQVKVDAPTVVWPNNRPYGPGLNSGVVVGPRDGCRNFNCTSGQYQNRPAHRRYYDNYFDVPKPDYSTPGKIGGNRALGGSHLTDTRPITGSDVEAGGRHRDWCAGRYRSYRAADNTFQPFDGPRRQCASPFS